MQQILRRGAARLRVSDAATRHRLARLICPPFPLTNSPTTTCTEACSSLASVAYRSMRYRRKEPLRSRSVVAVCSLHAISLPRSSLLECARRGFARDLVTVVGRPKAGPTNTALISSTDLASSLKQQLRQSSSFVGFALPTGYRLLADPESRDPAR